MLLDFTKHAQRYTVKRSYANENSNDLNIGFQDRFQIKSFFDEAMKDKTNCKILLRVAEGLYPGSCRPHKSIRAPSDQVLLSNLYADIDSGKLHVVLKNKEAAKKSQTSIEHTEKDPSIESDFLQLAKKYADKFQKSISKLFHADYHFIEKVYHFDENSNKSIPSIVDPSSITEHKTGWKPWDNPFDISALGAFKGAFSFSAANFLNLGKSAIAAAALGAKTELTSGQYFVTGKSIICRKWYGSYSIRYNLKIRSFEIGWVKYKGCGTGERLLVELKRKDRLLVHNKVIYEHPEQIVPPFTEMNAYLLNYKKGFIPPQHNIDKPIKISLYS